MASVFIKVPVSERLPSKDGDYWCKFKTYNALYIQKWVFELGGFGCNEDYEYWLEEIELPSEEEITIEADEYDSSKSHVFENGANFILNKLKGGKKDDN